MNHGLVLLALTTSLAACSTPAREAIDTAVPNAVGPITPDAFDSAAWTPAAQASATFGSQLEGAHALLLRGRDPTPGSLRPDLSYPVDLVVASQSAVVYHFAPPPSERKDGAGRDYCDDELELRDVTGDGVPEIVFHSCFFGGSDFAQEVHVLQYDSSTSTAPRFRDIGRGFVEMTWFRFRWLDYRGRVLAVQAEPEGDGTSGTACHACPKLHHYRVYAWKAGDEQFVEIVQIQSTGELHRSDDFFERDLPYIVRELEHPSKSAAD